MTFYTPIFLGFLCILLLFLHFFKKNNAQLIIFLIANVIFYGYWDYRFLSIIFLETIIIYFFGKLIAKKRKKWCVVLPTILTLSFLLVFKYYNFFIDSFCSMFHISNSYTLQLILPLGISFFTFQALSYIFDVYFKKIEVENNYLKIAVYVSFFPQIVSGPIVKAKDFLKQLDAPHSITKQHISEGVQIFLLGFIKKKVFADNIGVCVDAVYSTPTAYSGISVALAVIGYAMQIYCDFSGYSDMAIGVARMMGFDLGKNFNVPYIAKNPSDFWRRWHISLSTWFRDYIYIPLGGNRKGKVRTYLNLFITMLVSGLWHGASWNFVIWGGMHGIGSCAHKGFTDIKKARGIEKSNSKVKNAIAIICNFIFVTLLWVVFRADSMDSAFTIIASMFNTSGIMYLSPFVIIFTAMILLYNLYIKFFKNGNNEYLTGDFSKFSTKLIFFIILFLALAFAYTGNSAFIYAQF